MFFQLRFILLFLLVIPVCSPAQTRTKPTTETITIRTNQGTELGFDISPDGRTIVFDLLGQLWLVPAGGGKARAITDAVRDTAEDLDPSFSPDGKRVIFRGERNGRTGLWLLDVATGVLRQLTQLPDPDAYDGNASWSPDSRSIAFMHRVPPSVTANTPWRFGLMVLDVEVGTTREVKIEGITNPQIDSPVWMRDGKEIAFVVKKSPRQKGGRVWTVPASGGTATPLTDETLVSQTPSFSVDRRLMAYFEKDKDGRMQIWTQELGSGKPAVQLTSNADVTTTRIRWIPNTNDLLYSADGRMWKVAASGGPSTEIPFTAALSIKRPKRSLPHARFRLDAQPSSPARGFNALTISPAGDSIAVIALGKLWVITIRDSTVKTVARVPLEATNLAWSPDGTEVAWSAGIADKEDLFATKIATGVTRQLTALPGREVFPVYSPDGRSIAFINFVDTPTLRTIDTSADKISDVAQTRDLGRISSNQTCAPQWSPASDGLLVCGGTSLSQRGRATFVPISGERQTITRFPNAPIFLQWLPDGKLVFVRHDRLWESTIDRAIGTTSEPQPIGRSAALYLSASRDGTLLFVSDGGLKVRFRDGVERSYGWPIKYSTSTANSLIIRNVRIIDGTGTPATGPRDMLVQGGRIALIAEPGRITAPKDATVLDATGRFVTPGLIDLHAHVYRADLLAGWPYFGVTTIRDQGSSMAPLVAAADSINAGEIPGPRIAYGGFQYYSDWAFDEDQGRGIEPEADGEHIKRSVDLSEAFGAQHIKTRTFRRWDINARMITEAHRRGMRATGHCSHLLPLIAAGMDAKEHIGVCTERGNAHMYDDMIQLFKAAGIGVVPTISYIDYAVRLSEKPELLDADPEVIPFMPSKDNFEWMTKMDAARREDWAIDVKNAREGTMRLWQAGVTVGVGTDIWQIPTGVHMELEQLVAAGLTPAQAIRAATANSAIILGAEKELGMIKVGMRADLVLLDADPLTDVRNTRKIWNVIQDGRVVDRPAILKVMRPR